MRAMQMRVRVPRPAGPGGKKQDRLDDDAAALLIHTGYAFDVILILIGLIAVVTGHVAGGLGVAVLGVVALVAGWVVVELSDHFHR